MDFRRLLQEERRRARESGSQKPPEQANEVSHGENDTYKRATQTAVAHVAITQSNEPLSCWEPRTIPDLERFRVLGINRVYHIPDWITHEQEQAILDRVNDATASSAWVQLKHRRLQMYGGEVKRPFHCESLPLWLTQIVQSLVGDSIFPSTVVPNHALINEYGVGDCILPHEDGPSYWPFVAIVSTGADAFVNFAPHRAHKTHSSDDSDNSIRFAVRRRSLLLFTEDAYTKFLHSVDGVEAGKRVSLTIRHVLADQETTP